MRLVTFDKHGRPAPGVRRGDSIVDLAAAATGLKSDWPAIFAAGQLGRVAEIARSASGKTLLPAARTKLWVPIPDPPKIPCIGLNYVSHARETGMAIPDYPTVFNRFATSFAAPGAALIRPRASEAFDYEAELVIVIGKAGRHIAKEKALEHVAGYACGNDGSLRDYQMKTTQWLIGKNFDASGSWGPEIVTSDELPPGARGLGIRCRLNGETLQDGNTDDFIFDTETIVSTLSEVMTLEPGDIIFTGTPPGVGFVRKPPIFMKPGDTCEIEIEKIGVLRNSIADEG